MECSDTPTERMDKVQRVGLLTMMTILLASVLASCGGGEEEAAQEEETTSDEMVVGGFGVVGPTGELIEVPAVTTDPSDAETYLDTVRPVLEDTNRDLARQINPSAQLQDQTLTLSIGIESVEQADEAVEEGLQALRYVEPPDSLEPIHELLVASYEEAVLAYDELLEAFGGGELDELATAAQTSLPEIEQFNATGRAILQELDRAEGPGPDQDAPSQSRGTIEGTSVEEETTAE